MDKIIIANWKENPQTVEEAVSLAKAVDSEGVVIAPPFVFLEAVGKAIKKAALGAQDIFWEDKGAFTGEVSGSQLKNLGVKYVIVGHSERRRLGDTDEIVAKKIVAAFRNSIIPVLCVSETREERKTGKSKEALREQLEKDLLLVESQKPLNQLVIAYEPLWSISTEPNAEPDTPENAVSMISFIKSTVQNYGFKGGIKFIYGGSVNPENAGSFFREREIEGALVGRISLEKEKFKKIIDIANHQ